MVMLKFQQARLNTDHPRRMCEEVKEEGNGLQLFRNVVEYFNAN
jgi:hypothetical protein